MKFFFRIFLIIIFLCLAKASLTLSKVVTRVPRENDIGLIFDISITNTKDNSGRLLFSVRCGSGCNLELGGGRSMSDTGRVVGGSFGCVEPGATETVSLILPTISLYNRVGCCPIIITATNLKDEQTHIKESISFDTKFETLDPHSTGIRRSRKYKDCKNFDLDYLNDCKPVNCEERYFGVRNFFSECTQSCEPVPMCQGNALYDPFANECVAAHYAVSKKDIHDIKRGLFKNYAAWTSEVLHNSKSNHGTSRHNKRASFDAVDIESNDLKTISNDESLHSSWLKGVIDGLLLVFATIGIYVIICFIIFLLVSCISRRQSLRGSISFSAPPSVSEKGIPIRSRSSLLSRR